MSLPGQKITPEQRKASMAHRSQMRQARSGTLNLRVVRGFLQGKISFSDINRGDGRNNCRVYPMVDKVLVAWALIIARPYSFGFRVNDNGELKGSLHGALRIIFPRDSFIDSSSLNNGLHIKSGRGVKATPSRALVALIQQYIDAPEGGIVKYFKSQGQEPPTEIDPEILLVTLPADARTHKPTRSADVPPSCAKAIAQKALEELRELYGPKVLAELKHML